MKIEFIESVVKLISTHGLAIIISAVFIISQRNALKSQADENKKYHEKLIATLTLIEDTILNNHIPDNSLMYFTRVRLRDVIKTYISEILYYILRNNLSKNQNVIKDELESTMNSLSERTLELFKMITNSKKAEILNTKINDCWKELHREVIEKLEKTKMCDDIDYTELAREIRNKANDLITQGFNDINSLTF